MRTGTIVQYGRFKARSAPVNFYVTSAVASPLTALPRTATLTAYATQKYVINAFGPSPMKRLVDLFREETHGAPTDPVICGVVQRKLKLIDAANYDDPVVPAGNRLSC